MALALFASICGFGMTEVIAPNTSSKSVVTTLSSKLIGRVAGNASGIAGPAICWTSSNRKVDVEDPSPIFPKSKIKTILS